MMSFDSVVGENCYLGLSGSVGIKIVNSIEIRHKSGILRAIACEAGMMAHF